MTIAGELARWSGGLRFEDVPEAVRRAAARQLLDGVGTALAARRLRAVDAGLALATGLGGPPEAAPLGARSRLSAPMAAFADGLLVHGLDFDDTHADGLVHATAVVLPAAFAVGSQLGATGRDVLTACVAGYETVSRVGAASPYGFHARGLHATQVAGVFSAAVVAARLAGLGADTVTHALGIAGSSAGGLLEFLAAGATTKQLHPASASMSGVMAARLAALGATGPATVFEGSRGLYAALSERPADPGAVVRALGTTWESLRITTKPYPSCQLMHAALDAITAALPRATVKADEIVSVTVDVHPDGSAVVCTPARDKARPRTAYDAKFSLPWTVAALLVDGNVTLDTYTDASLDRPEIADLAARVRTNIVPGAMSAADAPGRVEVRFADGSTHTAAVPHSRGGPEAPLSDAELSAKFLGNTGDSGAARELLDRVLRLEDEPDLAAITELSARAAEEHP